MLNPSSAEAEGFPPQLPPFFPSVQRPMCMLFKDVVLLQHKGSLGLMWSGVWVGLSLWLIPVCLHVTSIRVATYFVAVGIKWL